MVTVGPMITVTRTYEVCALHAMPDVRGSRAMQR